MTMMTLADAADAGLNGVQKVAVLLMGLDRTRAARLLRELAPDEVAAVARELERTAYVAAPTIDGVIEDFARSAIAQRGDIRVTPADVRELLEMSLGEAGAAEIFGQTDARRFRFFDTFEIPALIALLADEHPQTIAVVLAHLNPERAARVLAGFDEERQRDLGIRIATLERSNPAALDAIEAALEDRARTVLAEQAEHRVGGTEGLIAMLTRSDKNTERAVLAELERIDPAMAEEVRSKLFTFEDIVTLDDRAVQQILRQVDTRGLAVALKGADEATRTKVLTNMSSRASENLLEEIDMLRGIRAADVAVARAEIVKVIRSLEDSGDIVIDRGIDELVD